MDTQAWIIKTKEYVQEQMHGEATGHDWWHMYRVWNLAKTIAATEGGDMTVIELAALLHDIADWKFHNGDSSVGPRVAREWLISLNVDEAVIDHVCDIIATISFKGAGVATPMNTLEGMIVQDADRLDAIGALGIARTFAYGGAHGREMFDPEQSPTYHTDSVTYLENATHSINHFYEKLLLLKDRMNTATAMTLAQHRHEYMEQFLKEFYNEWDGKR